MPKLKVNGNYNVLIKDIGIYVSSTLSPDISQAEFKSSSDLAKLITNGFIIIDNLKTIAIEKQDSDVSDDFIPVLQDGTTFVKEGHVVGVPEGVFVATPKGIEDKYEPLFDVTIPEEIETTVKTTKDEDSINTKIVTDVIIDTPVTEKKTLATSKIVKDTKTVKSVEKK